MSESQVASGRQRNEEMLNRSAVMGRFRQPYVDWLRSVKGIHEPGIFSAWCQAFAADAVLASATLDRLLHRSTVLTMRGENFRLQEKRKAGQYPMIDEPKGATA